MSTRGAVAYIAGTTCTWYLVLIPNRTWYSEYVQYSTRYRPGWYEYQVPGTTTCWYRYCTWYSEYTTVSTWYSRLQRIGGIEYLVLLPVTCYSEYLVLTWYAEYQLPGTYRSTWYPLPGTNSRYLESSASPASSELSTPHPSSHRTRHPHPRH